ncbi:hypothetical protein MBANPS3_002954 [Mucor bainieri]
MRLMREDPLGEQTGLDHANYVAVTSSLSNLKNNQAAFENLQYAAAAAPQATTKATVPSEPRFWQLKGEYQWKPKEESFESAYDFCVSFKKVLDAHLLPMDVNWRRLLPMCLNGEQLSWFEEHLANRQLTWDQAKTVILNNFDTPYRKFLLMAQVGSMRQGPQETNREYASRYQKLRREAGIEDGTSLAVSFFVSLRNSVKTATQVEIASRFGSSLPTSINQMIDLVNASDDSGLVTYKANEYNNTHHNKRAKRTDDENDSDNNLCRYNCGKIHFKGHRCDEYVQAMKERKNKKFQYTSRMAKRSPPKQEQNESWNPFALQNREATTWVFIAYISPTKHNLGLKTSGIVFYDLTLPCGSLFRNNLGTEEIDDFSRFRPCGSKAKMVEFREWMFSPRK